jgi:hypothetical protein
VLYVKTLQVAASVKHCRSIVLLDMPLKRLAESAERAREHVSLHAKF